MSKCIETYGEYMVYVEGWLSIQELERILANAKLAEIRHKKAEEQLMKEVK